MTTIELDRRPRMSMYCTIAFASISAAHECLNLNIRSADQFIICCSQLWCFILTIILADPRKRLCPPCRYHALSLHSVGNGGVIIAEA